MYTNLTTDAPVSDTLASFWTTNTPAAVVKDRVNQKLQAEAVDNAAELSKMSTFYFGSNRQKDGLDYTPASGCASLVQMIFNQKCAPDLHLSETVISIDYTGSTIIVTTNLAQYTTNHLFVGVSLGMLKVNQIQFNPPLPSEKQQAINAIGFGAYEKIFVTFDKSFWPAGKNTLNFVGKGLPSRYV